MIKTYKQSVWIICTLLALSSMSCRAELVVVANTAMDVDSLTRAQILNTWLGRLKILPNGEKPQAVDQAKGTVARNIFYTSVIKKSEKQLKAYWAKKSFIRAGSPPPTVANDEAVMNWVASHVNGLGYVDRSMVDSSVKIMMAIDQ